MRVTNAPPLHRLLLTLLQTMQRCLQNLMPSRDTTSAPLDEESQLLTTFITPFGRFKYLQAPYHISSISEHYNQRMDEAFAGLSGYRCVVDDVVIYDSDVAKQCSTRPPVPPKMC